MLVTSVMVDMVSDSGRRGEEIDKAEMSICRALEEVEGWNFGGAMAHRGVEWRLRHFGWRWFHAAGWPR